MDSILDWVGLEPTASTYIGEETYGFSPYHPHFPLNDEEE